MVRVTTSSGTKYEIFKNSMGIFAKRVSSKELREAPSNLGVLGTAKKTYRLKSMPVPVVGEKLKLRLDPEYHDVYVDGKVILTSEVVSIN